MKISNQEPKVFSFRLSTQVKAKRSSPLPKYTSRKILGTGLTSSITQPVVTVLKDHSTLRIEKTITDFYVDAKFREIFKMSMKREPTSAQGAQSSNKELTPTKKNQGRHLDPVSTVSSDVLTALKPVAEHVKKKGFLSPRSEKELRALKCKTPQRNAIHEKPSEVEEIIHSTFKKEFINIFENTHYGNNKHATTSSLVVSNQFDRLTEFRIRPLWDKLVKKQSQEQTTAKNLTLEFLHEQKIILNKLFEKSKEVPKQLETFFSLEKQITHFDETYKDHETIPQAELETQIFHLKTLLKIKQTILDNFSSCEGFAPLRERVNSWKRVKRILNEINKSQSLLLEIYKTNRPLLLKRNKTPQALEKEQKDLTNTGTNLCLEAQYQSETASELACMAVLDNLDELLFKEYNPSQKIFLTKSDQKTKEDLVGMLSPLKKE